jgi:hypothetical protein
MLNAGHTLGGIFFGAGHMVGTDMGFSNPKHEDKDKRDII